MPRAGRGAFVLAEEHPRSPKRHRTGIVVLLVAVLVLVGGAVVGARHFLGYFGAPTCSATAAGRTVSYDPEQMANAATITALSVKRGLPPRAATIAIATAIQESKLRNINYGDRDSVGLFQQRPSQGWGSVEEIMDPVYSAGKFYDALVKITGYENMEITKVAQAVQRSAAPEAYAQHEPEARVLASTLSGHSPAAVGCRLASPDAPGQADQIEAALLAQFGVQATHAESTLTLEAPSATTAWAVAHWAVAHAENFNLTTVTVAGREWRRGDGKDALQWGQGGSANATAVRLTLH